MRHSLHYFHCLISCMSLSSLVHTDYFTYIFKCQVLTPVWLISTILLYFIMIYFIFILCSLIYRPRHQVTSQIVIWTTRVIDLSVLLIFILIFFFVTMSIRIYCFYHKHFSSAIRLLFYCLRYQIRSDTIFATSGLQFTIFSVYSSGVT